MKTTHDHQLLRQILRDTDPDFTRWAIARLLQWPGRPDTPTIRLHGTDAGCCPTARPTASTGCRAGI